MVDDEIKIIPAPKNIKIHPVYFYNGLVKANVTWDEPKGNNASQQL